MDSAKDWQQTIHTPKERLKYLFKTKKLSDCTFTFGNENEPHKEEISSHKLVLAMTSPVFEAMFFGGIANNNKPIEIIDIPSDAFKSILKYLYTDEIQITSVEKGYKIFYGAKKYMLPFLMEQCVKFFLSVIEPKNVIKLYEFAKFYEEPLLINACLEVMRTETIAILNEPSFEDANPNTILAILDQDSLNIESELDLFNAVERYIQKNKLNISVPAASTLVTTISDNNSDSGFKTKEHPVESSKTFVADDNIKNAKNVSLVQNSIEPDYSEAIKKIRYLTLSPNQFAAGPAKSNLLTQTEVLSILMSISLPEKDCSIPEGFTQNRCSRATTMGGLICVRSLRNSSTYLQSVSKCHLTLQTTSSVYITGIQVQKSTHPILTKDITVYIYDNDNGFYDPYYNPIPHISTSIAINTEHINQDKGLVTYMFKEPVFIQDHKAYSICLIFSTPFYCLIHNYATKENCENVNFDFSCNQYNKPNINDGLIQGIIFEKQKNFKKK